MHNKILIAFLFALLSRGAAAELQSEVDVWKTLLRPQYFGDREIIESKSMVELRIPFRAETDISISEDPSFRFFFKPQAGGTLTAEMTASKGRIVMHSFEVDSAVAALEP